MTTCGRIGKLMLRSNYPMIMIRVKTVSHSGDGNKFEWTPQIGSISVQIFDFIQVLLNIEITL